MSIPAIVMGIVILGILVGGVIYGKIKSDDK
jgi:ABC-type phosphate transport system permease subunit